MHKFGNCFEAHDIDCSCQQVRGLGVSHDGVIATGSRDKSVRIWDSKQGEREYNLDKTLVGHTNFVGTVAWISPTESLPAGGLVSGGMDTRVLVWDLEKAAIANDMKGHKLQVSDVAVDSNGDILSASVDRYRYFDGIPLMICIFYIFFPL